MIPWWALAVFVLGANFALWGSVGLIRLAESLAARLAHGRRAAAGPAGPGDGQARPGDGQARPGDGQARPGDGGMVMAVAGEDRLAHRAPRSALSTKDVAVLIPAHNEALVIEESLRSIMALVPRQNVHVVSDGSTDATVQIARRAGAQVIETRENLGKAGALDEAIGRFGLIDRFPVVMLLDADTRVQPGYFAAGLPMFDNPQVVAVAGCVRTARDRKLTFGGNVLVGHRTRIYAVGQRALKFGQTWRYANATPIVPGFASMYRTSVLPRMELNPPGLVIEDFNMTFEVYQKRLGQVGFTMRAVAVTQDPDNLHDYVRQTKRWAVGLWQTVRRHPPRANLFTSMLTLLLLELITSSLMFFLLPLALLVLAVPDLVGGTQAWPVFNDVHTVVAAHITLTAVLFGVVIPDYLLTCAVAMVERQPRLLLVGLLFPALRMLDAAIGLYAIPAAWLSASNGRWQSPARRALGGVEPGRAGGVEPGRAGGVEPGRAGGVQANPAGGAEPKPVPLEASHVSG